MEFQHVNAKVLLKNPQAIEWEALIPVFHSWIEGQSNEDLLLDVADYRHVPGGPGIVLVGHDANYSLDNAGGRPGVRYHRKSALDGTSQDRLTQAAQSALAATQRLEADPRLHGTVQFNGHDIEIVVNDRLLAPNTPQTRVAADADLRQFLSSLFGDSEYSLTYSSDPRELFSVKVCTARACDTVELLDNLNLMVPVSR
jgi:hypothetical protein